MSPLHSVGDDHASCEEARSTFPRGRKDQVWEPAVLLCWELPSLRSIFMYFNKGFPKIVPLTKRVTSVAGTSSIVTC